MRRTKVTGENQQPMLRSINNVHRSYVKFVNKTLHHVVLYWIDYQGQAVSYGVLRPDEYRNIDTFVTHPWIFIDKDTQDTYTVNQRNVFFPEPSSPSSRGHRRYVYITLPLYTLRELSLKAIRRCLSHNRQPFQLDIPRSLQLELANMLPKSEDDSDGVRKL